MKHLLLIVILVFYFVSCSKKQDNPSDPQPPTQLYLKSVLSITNNTTYLLGDFIYDDKWRLKSVMAEDTILFSITYGDGVISQTGKNFLVLYYPDSSLYFLNGLDKPSQKDYIKNNQLILTEYLYQDGSVGTQIEYYWYEENIIRTVLTELTEPPYYYTVNYSYHLDLLNPFRGLYYYNNTKNQVAVEEGYNNGEYFKVDYNILKTIDNYPAVIQVIPLSGVKLEHHYEYY